MLNVKVHTMIPRKNRGILFDFMSQHEIPFAVTYGVNPVGEQMVITTVELDEIPDEDLRLAYPMSVQAECNAYDITPYIHVQPHA